jgi:hypothetical protein
MKSPTCSPALAEQKFSRLLPPATLDELARASGFCQRAARKCTPLHFVVSFFRCLSLQLWSLSGWAGQLSALGGTTLARQSLSERFSACSSRFALQLLSYLLGGQTQLSAGCRRAVGAFSAVLLQDSTTVPLQDGLQGEFKGNCSHGQPKALLRVKAIVDLLTMQVLHLGLTSCAENDQAAASNIHSLVRHGTLVLRDRGYWSPDSLSKIAARGAFFLSRLRYGMNLYDPGGGKLFLKELLGKKALDRPVPPCERYRLPVRLLVVPLPPEVAARRVRRARTHRDHRLHHSRADYRFCRYEVFVTNAPQEQLPLAAAADLYRLRWQVEVLFKALKSGALQLPRLVRDVKTNTERVRTTVALALCFVVLSLQRLAVVITQHTTTLSVLKLLRWARAHLELLLAPDKNTTLLHLLVPYYCRYEKRKRMGLRQKLQALT